MSTAVFYSGSITLTPYHTQAMLPWVVSALLHSSKRSDSAVECSINFSEGDMVIASVEAPIVTLVNHPTANIARFIRPPHSERPTLAYLEKIISDEQIYRLHAFESYNSAQLQTLGTTISRYMKESLSKKSVFEATAQNMSEFNVIWRGCGAVPSPPRPLTPVVVDELQADNSRKCTLRLGREELFIVCSDDSGVLARRLVDITACCLGDSRSKAVCFVCRENNALIWYMIELNDSDVAYIVRERIVEAVKICCKNAAAKRVVVCPHCPMQYFHRLCKLVEGAKTPAEVHSTVMTWMETIPASTEENQQISRLLHALKIPHGATIPEENDMLITVLRLYHEEKQKNHIHVQDSNSQMMKESFLGNISKAKKTLKSSLDVLKVPQSASSHNLNSDDDRSLFMKKQTSAPVSPMRSPEFNRRHRSGSEGPRWGGLPSGLEANLRRLKEKLDGNNTDNVLRPPIKRHSITNVFRGVPTWRQNIYTLVTTPIKKSAIEPESAMSVTNNLEIEMHFYEKPNEPPRNRTSADYRALWKRAILDQILLIRMEKENSFLRGNFLIHIGRRTMVIFPACQDAIATKRMKLDYNEVCQSPEEVGIIWADVISQGPQAFNYDYVSAAVKTGVPKEERGAVWEFLRQFNKLRLQRDENDDIFFQYNYRDLVRKQCRQQNDIFLDLDRTFPMHSYFQLKYNSGQLALYNLLRAYSIIDEDIGYCQGMSFVAGVLLMHLSEEESFKMLIYIMRTLNLRRQYRPPNMTGLQVKQYQLQRLIHDKLPRLDQYLQKLEISPTLYATGWFLTLFSSQFSLGLVTRIFDLILLDGPDVIFKVILVILEMFEEEILRQSSFEYVVSTFQKTIPRLVDDEIDTVVNKTYEIDSTLLARQLFSYEVEYQVLRDEELANLPGVLDSSEALLERVVSANKKLTKQNYELEIRLDASKKRNFDLQDSVAQLQKTESQLLAKICSLEHENRILVQKLKLHNSEHNPSSNHLT